MQRKSKQTSSDVLDVHEAAWFVGAHVETIRRLARKGNIPAYKVGRDWRFSKPVLKKWCENQHHLNRTSVVMVVDDEKSLRETAGIYLERAGYIIQKVAGGAEALRLLRTSPPDLVVLDLAMPEVSGVEVLKEISAHHEGLPVIVATGYPDGVLMKQALEFAPFVLLAKPVEADKLVDAVGRSLANPRVST